MEEHVETIHKQIDIITNQLLITYCTFKIHVPKLLDVPTIYHDLMIKVSQILKLNDLKKLRDLLFNTMFFSTSMSYV